MVHFVKETFYVRFNYVTDFLLLNRATQCVQTIMLAAFAAIAIAFFHLGLFSVLGFLAVPVGLPLAFYQATAAGALAPPGAAPGWLSWINDFLPLHEILSGYRAIAIGGPEGAVPILGVFLFLLVGLGLIWAGTAGHALLWPRNVENKIPFF